MPDGNPMWIEERKTRAEKLIRVCYKELRQYRRGKNISYLYQASEKVWIVYNILLEIKTQNKIESGKELSLAQSRVVGIPEFDILKENAWALHLFHYRGSYPEDLSYVVLRVRAGLKLISKIRSKYNMRPRGKKKTQWR